MQAETQQHSANTGCQDCEALKKQERQEYTPDWGPRPSPAYRLLNSDRRRSAEHAYHFRKIAIASAAAGHCRESSRTKVAVSD